VSAAEPEVRSEARRGRALAVGAVILLLAAALVVLLVAVRPRRARSARVAQKELAATVTTEVAELRRGPSAAAVPVARLRRGSRLSILTERGEWVQVRTEGKELGFLRAGSLETDADRDARRKRAEKLFSFPAIFGVIAEDTDVMLAPFALGPRAGRLRKGETIRIHAVDHDYYAFRQADGDLGFVRSSDVDLVPPDPRRPPIVPEAGKAPKDVKVSNLSPAVTPVEPGETSEPGVESSVRASAEEEPAELVSKVDPPYPEAARRSGVEGTVVLDVRIDESGAVTDIQVLRGLPLGVSEAAVAAVSRWKYRPARGRTGPVTSHKTVRVIFRLGP
jgi:TonB family protein